MISTPSIPTNDDLSRSFPEIADTALRLVGWRRHLFMVEALAGVQK
jgi:hypothetical protein